MSLSGEAVDEGRSTDHAIVLGVLFRHRCYRWKNEQAARVSTMFTSMEDSQSAVGDEEAKSRRKFELF